MTSRSIEFVDLAAQYAALRSDIDAGISQVLAHGQYIMGPEVRELEERLEAYTGAGHCIAVASGTEALLISLMALGVGPGDEVITTPFTFVATAETIRLVGATPVFVDIERDTYNIDVSAIEAVITPKTRAILPVSLYGQAADMDEITALAARCGGIPVIEDAAQSFGAVYRDRKSCNLSPIACTSFFPSKPLGCYGDGGAIFTDDAALAQAMREIRVHGQERRYHHTRIGVGGRMDTLQCAIVLAKLKHFDAELEARAAAARRYIDLLDGLPGIVLPTIRNDRTSAWAQFTIRVKNRDDIAGRLKAAGVPTAVHYPLPLHQQPAYQVSCRADRQPVHAEAAAEEVLCLPMHAYITQEDQKFIAEALAAALEAAENGAPV